MLPPGQYDIGMVIIDHKMSASAMPISGASGVIGCLCAVRSMTCAVIAIPPARNAMRISFRTGNHACGESNSTDVKAINA